MYVLVLYFNYMWIAPVMTIVGCLGYGASLCGFTGNVLSCRVPRSYRSVDEYELSPLIGGYCCCNGGVMQ